MEAAMCLIVLPPLALLAGAIVGLVGRAKRDRKSPRP